jgi:hypothetical protein
MRQGKKMQNIKNFLRRPENTLNSKESTMDLTSGFLPRALTMKESQQFHKQQKVGKSIFDFKFKGSVGYASLLPVF